MYAVSRSSRSHLTESSRMVRGCNVRPNSPVSSEHEFRDSTSVPSAKLVLAGMPVIAYNESRSQEEIPASIITIHMGL